MNNKETRRKALTRTELADMYGITYPTLVKWIKDIPGLGLDPRKRILTPKQVGLVIEHLGNPYISFEQLLKETP